MKDPDPIVHVRPILVGPRNCEALTGLPWRHLCTHYRHLAVKIGKKLVIPADALLAEFRIAPPPPLEEEHIDQAEAVRRAIGVRKR